MYLTITEEMLKGAGSRHGGYSTTQINMGKRINEKRWKKKLVGVRVSEDWWNRFCAAKPKSKQQRKEIAKALKMERLSRVEFYRSPAWRKLRIKILNISNRRCMLCGQSPNIGVSLHVDHIKPRSKYPELSLDPDNLQVLCEDCNLGKSDQYYDDYRDEMFKKRVKDFLITDSEEEDNEIALDNEAIESIPTNF